LNSGEVPAFEIEDLVVRYGAVTAVDRLSLSSPPGRITAVLGPNGAGKSSLLTALSTAARPAAGRIRIGGADVDRAPMAVRAQLGVVFQERTLDQELSVERNLWFHARLFGMSAPDARSRIAGLLAEFGLTDRRRQRIEQLSGGLARRVEIARALLHRPTLIVLDEPTDGLDPTARRVVWDDLRRLRADFGVTVLYCTHYMDEAEFADRIVILHEGRVVRHGSPADLKSGLRSSRVQLVTRDDRAAAAQLAAAGFPAVPERGGLAVACTDPERQIAAVLRAVDVPVLVATVAHPSMDDVFTAATAALAAGARGPDRSLT
jgi:ABC-2 type transport system ATP-binding protein